MQAKDRRNIFKKVLTHPKEITILASLSQKRVIQKLVFQSAVSNALRARSFKNEIVYHGS
jgi:hypothetical protein